MSKSRCIITRLLADGPMTTSQLASKTKLEQQDVASILRKWLKAKRYGVTISGTTRPPGHSGPPHNLWAIDRAAYSEYMALRAQSPSGTRVPRAAKPQPAPPAKIQALIARARFHTAWQPTSPYYQGATT